MHYQATVEMHVITRWTFDKPLEQENKWKIYVDDYDLLLSDWYLNEQTMIRSSK